MSRFLRLYLDFSRYLLNVHQLLDTPDEFRNE